MPSRSPWFSLLDKNFSIVTDSCSIQSSTVMLTLNDYRVAIGDIVYQITEDDLVPLRKLPEWNYSTVTMCSFDNTGGGSHSSVGCRDLSSVRINHVNVETYPFVDRVGCNIPAGHIVIRRK